MVSFLVLPLVFLFFLHAEVLTVLWNFTDWRGGDGLPPLFRLWSLNRTLLHPQLLWEWCSMPFFFMKWCLMSASFLLKNKLFNSFGLFQWCRFRSGCGGDLLSNARLPEMLSQSSLQMPGIWEEGGVCQCLFVSSPDLSFPTYSISLISSKSFDIWPILWMWTFLYGLFHLSHTKQQSWHIWPCCTIHIACNVIQARPFLLPFLINSLLCSNSA